MCSGTKQKKKKHLEKFFTSGLFHMTRFVLVLQALFVGSQRTVTSSLSPSFFRVCVQAPLPAGQLLQMDCLLHAWAEPPEEGRFRERGALHVQSLSHWAPANIGPYSQALRVSAERRRRRRE